MTANETPGRVFSLKYMREPINCWNGTSANSPSTASHRKLRTNLIQTFSGKTIHIITLTDFRFPLIPISPDFHPTNPYWTQITAKLRCVTSFKCSSAEGTTNFSVYKGYLRYYFHFYPHLAKVLQRRMHISHVLVLTGHSRRQVVVLLEGPQNARSMNSYIESDWNPYNREKTFPLGKSISIHSQGSRSTRPFRFAICPALASERVTVLSTRGV